MARFTTSFVVVLCIVAGCAQPEVPTIERTRLLTAGFDPTWKAVIATVAEHAYPIQAIEKESGILAIDDVLLAKSERKIRGYAVLPNVPLGGWRDLMCSINFVVTETSPEATQIRVNVAMKAYEYNWSPAWHPVHSRGVIEARLLGEIESRLR